jgi:hypothetical protein
MVASRGKDLNLNIGCQNLECEEKITCGELDTDVFTVGNFITDDLTATNSLTVKGYVIEPLAPIITTATIGGVTSPIMIEFLLQGQQRMVSGNASYSVIPPETEAYDDAFAGLAGIIWELPNVYFKVTGHIEFTATSTIPMEFRILQGGGFTELNPVKSVLVPSTTRTNTANIESIFGATIIGISSWVALKMALTQNGPNDITITNWSLTCQYISELPP